MFPYLEFRPIEFGVLSLSAVRGMLAVAILTGYFLVRERARRRRLDVRLASRLVLAMLGFGFTGAHVFKAAYFDLPDFNFMTIVNAVSGMASFGGIFGGIGGAAWYLRRRGLDLQQALTYLDAVAFVFPCAWVFGRFSCYLAHDHPGVRTESWLGVQYPGGTRFDLGLIEVFFMLGVVATFQILDRWRRPAGFYLSTFLVIYGTFRLALDQLHITVNRYWGWSVDQWASAAAIGLGLLALRPLRKKRLEKTRLTEELA
ncbi:MAG: prolipoprotein diacylglyceryl transferase [Bryobacteraceae bacterium]|nr:prolipoprotein diacylglyceryl transferase [Bryobacteraceae bacterium]